MCLQDSDCSGDDRCCFNGCQNDCVPPGKWNIMNFFKRREYIIIQLKPFDSDTKGTKPRGHIGSISAAVLETSRRSFPEKRLVIEPRGLIKDSYFRGCHFFFT